MALKENLGFRDSLYVELGVFLMGNNSRTGIDHFSGIEGNRRNT